MYNARRFIVFGHAQLRSRCLGKQLSPNSTRLNTTRLVAVACRDVTCRAFSNIPDEEVIVIACTSLVMCSGHRKAKTRSVVIRDYLTVFDTLRYVRLVY